MKKILLAVDGSETSLKAAEQAKKLAQAFGSEIVILSVAHEPELHIFTEGAFLPDIKEEQAKILKARIIACEKLAKSIAEENVEKGIKVDYKVREGRPSDEIIKEADQEPYDLIILGSRGLTGVKRFVLGTVSGKVANNSICSVMIVK
ncbi:nucleotide-binding universal stress UspA family protein [Desulfitispora alkaliphila]|uniref:universal stress protein n=1 Tax=Desulfitispora alkaliphila TaxID=622674 RepID=UPI003D240A86